MSDPILPTQFTRESARRIAQVVRSSELTPAPARPLNFERVDFSKARVFRVATFEGDWPIGSSKVVTFKNQTTTPNTVSATNLFLPLPSNGQRDCAIAKDGAAWYLVQVQWNEQAFVSSATLTTASLTFTRHAGVSLGTASTVAITTITCA